MKVHAIVGQQGFEIEGDVGAGFKPAPTILVINGKRVQVDFRSLESGVLSLLVDGKSYEVVVRRDMHGSRTVKGSYIAEIAGHILPVRLGEPGRQDILSGADDQGPGTIESPMPGRIVGIKVAVGQEVSKGQGVILVEAMKMENELTAPKSGKIKEIKVKLEEAVEGGQELIVIA